MHFLFEVFAAIAVLGSLGRYSERYATVCDTIGSLSVSKVFRRSRTSKADNCIWAVSDCRLSRFIWFVTVQKWCQTQACRRRDVDRSLIRVADHIYRVIYPSPTRFWIFLKTETFFSSFFLLRLYLAYWIVFASLDENAKTMEIQSSDNIPTACLTEHA